MEHKITCICGKCDLTEINKIYEEFGKELDILKNDELVKFNHDYAIKSKILLDKFLNKLKETSQS